MSLLDIFVISYEYMGANTYIKQGIEIKCSRAVKTELHCRFRVYVIYEYMRTRLCIHDKTAAIIKFYQPQKQKCSILSVKTKPLVKKFQSINGNAR